MPDRRLATERADHVIESDGTTVWINAASGICLARFGVMGIDIHGDLESQMAGRSECLLCTHERTGRADWDRFVEGMLRFHGIVVPASHRPARLAE